MPDRVVVVGASVAGFCVVEELRRLGFDGRICLIGDEEVAPYDRPPLSKAVLQGEQGLAEVMLVSQDRLADLDVDLRLGRAAAALDGDGRSVWLSSGESVPFDALIVATGASARRPPFAAGMDGVHVLRTVHDALAIRADLERRRRIVVVGAGFIGAEVAASLRACGPEVTLVDPLPAPLAAVVGPTVGGFVADLHAEHGTVLEMAVGVAALEGGARVERVVLTDGRKLPAEIVVIGLGAEPNTAWLEASGLTVANGVVCDASGATNIPGIYAIGDVARWHHPHFGEPVRIEHWSNARIQAGVVAKNLTGDAGPATNSSLPTFWSDQFDWRIQMVGAPGPDDEVVVDGEPSQGRFAALYGRAEKVVGVLAVNAPRVLIERRQLVADGASWSEAVQAAGAA